MRKSSIKIGKYKNSQTIIHISAPENCGEMKVVRSCDETNKEHEERQKQLDVLIEMFCSQT